MRLAVVGAGWAGLAAAVRARQAGAQVTVYEMAASAGGRARSYTRDGHRDDNGQHILIGAYTASLDLMRTVGVDTGSALLRLPLELRFADGSGLSVPPGPPLLAALRGIAGIRGWSWHERLALLRRAAAWQARGYRCAPDLSVEALCADLPARVRHDLIEPLCVAALNTRAARASAAVFLRVLHDALFGLRGGSDLLLPRVPLAELLAEPAWAWLGAAGATLRAATRVEALEPGAEPRAATWRIAGAAYDAVVLACPAGEAARLAEPHAPAWAARARAIGHEAIASVTLVAEGLALPAPMVALREDASSPAQFAFDRGALGIEPGAVVAVVSGAAAWLDRPLAELGEIVRGQLQRAFPGLPALGRAVVRRTVCEKRATFACTPGLDRPPAQVAPGLVAAGDYVEGPYPSTLEGAVRSADAALSLCSSAFRHAESAP